MTKEIRASEQSTGAVPITELLLTNRLLLVPLGARARDKSGASASHLMIE